MQPAFGLTADDADSMLGEASYTEDAEAVVGEIGSFRHGERRRGQDRRSRLRRRMLSLLLHSGDSFSLCVTAQCPEEAIEGNGARMAEMVASIAFVA